jgi:hypothetical protein
MPVQSFNEPAWLKSIRPWRRARMCWSCGNKS